MVGLKAWPLARHIQLFFDLAFACLSNYFAIVLSSFLERSLYENSDLHIHAYFSFLQCHPVTVSQQYNITPYFSAFILTTISSYLKFQNKCKCQCSGEVCPDYHSFLQGRPVCSGGTSVIPFTTHWQSQRLMPTSSWVPELRVSGDGAHWVQFLAIASKHICGHDWNIKTHFGLILSIEFYRINDVKMH
jgi:hypothetical protein